MLENIYQDLKYAWRSLARRPLVTSVAVVSLALGIGLNTAIFSVFERVILRRLAVPAPEEIVYLTSPGPKPGGRSTSNAGGVDHVFSYPLFRDLEGLERTGLSRIAAHRGFTANVAYAGQSGRAEGLLISGGYFPALRTTPALGRLLTPDDDRVPGGHPVVVLGYRYWTNRLGADRRVLGKALVINGEPMTVVGVAAADFTGTAALDVPDMFAPLSMAGRLRAGSMGRRDHYLYLLARLQSGTSHEQAEAALNGPFSALIRDVELPFHAGDLSDRAREQFLARRIVLQDGSRTRIGNRGEARVVLLLVLAVTGLVLLIACANVANLLLTRAADRSPEMAVRLSMGASTGRLVRLLLVEAMLLGMSGAIGAMAVARGATIAVLRMMPAEAQLALGFELNASVLLFTLALGLATGLLFGLLPALHGVRVSLVAAATRHAGRGSPSRGSSRFRTSLATAQIALATALLAVA